MDAEPDMAVAFSRSTDAEDDQPWNRIHSTRSQPSLRAPKKRATANQIRARPADPAVISTILDSFDTLTPPPHTHGNDAYLETASSRGKHARSDSADGIASQHSATPGFGMEYGSSASVVDEADTSDAAPPPSIRTSRPPSGMSSYVAHRTRSMNSESISNLRPASNASVSSSFSCVSKDVSGKNKHSAESWIKGRPTKQESPSKVRLGRSPSSKSRRSLRRVTSQETLRPPTINEFDGRLIIAEQPLTRAEQIIARTPPPLAGKGRLYLTDAVSGERLETGSPVSIAKTSDSSDSPEGSQATNLTDPATLNPTPQRLTPRKSPIVDSIPTRTSSLRQASSSPAGRKREKKSKRRTGSKVDTMSAVRSRSIPESSWADLGEDDDTVKRIRQLREQRKSRLEEGRHFSMLAEIPQSVAESVVHTPASELTPRRSDEAKRVFDTRPSANRAVTEPANKARKVLGLNEQVPMPGFRGVIISRPTSISPERTRRSQSRLEEKALGYLQSRPTTASPPTPPLSLDYSYAQAVDALHGVERELGARDKAHEREISKDSSISPGAGDLSYFTTPDLLPAPGPRQRTKSASRREARNRWTAHHPDLPLDLQEKRKSRRKSMSDARRTRVMEDEHEVQRRDSIELAVVEYLKDPRLSRRVKHAVTGRTISFSEVGDPEGAAVFVCVGMGLTRFVTAFYDELATTLRLRLITVDRPGVGGSEPYPPADRSGPLSWPEDILAISQHLGITKFSLLAHSAGAIYALATALTLPHLVRGKVHLLAPWIPPSQLEAVATLASTPPAGALPRSQRLLRVLPTSFLKAANSSFMTATSASLKPASKRQMSTARERSREDSLSPTRAVETSPTTYRPEINRRESIMLMDQSMPNTNPMENFPFAVKEEDEHEGDSAVPRGSPFLSATATPTDPSFAFATAALNAAEHAERERQLDYTSRLTQLTWELATRDSNPATDLLVCLERHREIGFRYTDVVREVVITHGAEDKRVPVANIRWLADQINMRAYAAGGEARQSRDGWADARYSRGGCEVRVLEGEGHGLMASAPIMSDVLTEIAGYWAGQLRGGSV